MTYESTVSAQSGLNFLIILMVCIFKKGEGQTGPLATETERLNDIGRQRMIHRLTRSNWKTEYHGKCVTNGEIQRDTLERQDTDNARDIKERTQRQTLRLLSE